MKTKVRFDKLKFLTYYIFTILICFVQLNFLLAQNICNLSNRYDDRVFQNIDIIQNITYANSPLYNGLNVNLKLDIYKPSAAEENVLQRPLVVMFFGGSYLVGSKNDADIVAWCDSLAHCGYVCAAVNYRLDNFFNIGLPNQMQRAGYRAIQDGRAAIRYLIEDPNNFGLNIDTNFIFTGGQSAGAITAINIAYLEESERTAETYFTNFLNPDLGCLDCVGNNYTNNFSVKAVLNLWGAVLNLNHLDFYENIPVVMFHGQLDNVVPYNSGSAFGVSTLPTIFGSLAIHNQLNTLNIVNQLNSFPNEGHVVYGFGNALATPNANWNPIYYAAKNFFYDETLAFETQNITGLKVLPCINDTFNFQTNAVFSNAQFCFEVDNGNIIDSDLNSADLTFSSFPAYIYTTEINELGVVGKTDTTTIVSEFSTAFNTLINGSINTDSTYTAFGKIESIELINDNATVNYFSTFYIELKSGFATNNLGVNFNADIFSCY